MLINKPPTGIILRGQLPYFQHTANLFPYLGFIIELFLFYGLILMGLNAGILDYFFTNLLNLPAEKQAS